MENSSPSLNMVLAASKLPFVKRTEDLEAQEYAGFLVEMGGKKMVCRTAKVTPKKVGLFVTLWQRNKQGITEPYDADDPIDLIFIETIEQNNNGFFLFPKALLIQKQIFSSEGKGGKRGFRIYPSWSNTGNPQAHQTKSWQAPYFFDLSTDNKLVIAGAEKLLRGENSID